MTRINVLHPSQLTDKWLVVEYRELPRVSNLARPVLRPPQEYKLGTGHVLFFYDKGLYLQKRFQDLLEEMHKRGYKPAYDSYREHPAGLNQDWQPDDAARSENIRRLLEKFDLGQRHSYYGKQISKEEFIKLVDNKT